MTPSPVGKPDASDFLALVDSYRIAHDHDVEVVSARLLPGLRADASEVTAALEAFGGKAYLSDASSQTHVVVLRRLGPPRRERWLLHVGLFLLTAITALAAGALLRGIDPVRTRFLRVGDGLLPFPTGLDPGALGSGAVFAVPFLLILLGHELGHYLVARRHGIPVTPPYFIPCPPWYSLVGTLGAFIRIRGPSVRRSILFDVGVAGPLVSFALALPALIVGLFLSAPVPGSADLATPFIVDFAGETVWIGNGVLLHLLAKPLFPSAFGSAPILLHPLAFAGWLGLFVTALNLMPLGQLDGGHILYALWAQPRQERAARLFLLALIPLGTLWWGWWLWGGAALLVNRGRLRHPPVLQPEVPLDPLRRRLATLAILVFVLTFTAVPLAL